MTLVEQWPALENGLPAGWGSARLELTVTKGDAEKAAALLGPAQPLRVAPGVFRLTTARDGTALNPTAVKRLVAHLDEQGIGGTLELVSSEAAPVTPPRAAEKTLAQSWDDALATLPADQRLTLAARASARAAASARLELYPHGMDAARALDLSRRGAVGPAGMVKRCLERCDEKGIRGTVRVVRVLCDTRPVATQGPVWHMGGRTV